MEAFCAYCQRDIDTSPGNECPECGSDCGDSTPSHCIKCEKITEELVDDLCRPCHVKVAASKEAKDCDGV